MEDEKKYYYCFYEASECPRCLRLGEIPSCIESYQKRPSEESVNYYKKEVKEYRNNKYSKIQKEKNVNGFDLLISFLSKLFSILVSLILFPIICFRWIYKKEIK